MNQRQVILTVVAVGLVSAALWAWHQGSENAPAQAAAPTPANPFSPSSGRVAAASDSPAPAAAEPAQAEAAPSPSAAPDVSQTAVSVPVEPANMDTPEPAERKFARGAQPQSDQN